MSGNTDMPPEPEPLRTVQQLWDTYIAGKRARKGFARYEETKHAKDAFYAGITMFLGELHRAWMSGEEDLPDAHCEDWAEDVDRELKTSQVSETYKALVTPTIVGRNPGDWGDYK